MQRSTLFGVVSVFAICLAAGSAAADNKPRDNKPRDIATLEPDYLPLVPLDMSQARPASTAPAVNSVVHYVSESPATASRANYVGESPARATTAYYLTSSPPKSSAVSPAPIPPITTSKPAQVTQSPVISDSCQCSPPTLGGSYASAAPVLSGSVQMQPTVRTVGNPWSVVSAARPVVGPCSPCSSPTTVCSPAVCNTGAPVVAYRPVVAKPPLPPRHRFGRGLIGQPVVYVDGQPVRNALRWFFP